MKLNTLFAISAVVALLSALNFLVAPAQLWASYGVSADPATIWATRELGGSVVGYAVLAWFARRIVDDRARRLVVLAFLVSWAVGFAVVLLRQLSGAVNSLGWGAVVVSGLLTLAYGYFQFVRPESSSERF